MNRFVVLVALLVITLVIMQSPTSAQNAAPTPMAKIGPSSVWHTPATFLAAAHKACDSTPQPPSFAECFINQMSPGWSIAGGGRLHPRSLPAERRGCRHHERLQ